ncbi:MAG TPA: hypothetical protein VMU50_19735 [Polyangia bacterium]|nr:hypothetical protein [Polyangia bacterium]
MRSPTTGSGGHGGTGGSGTPAGTGGAPGTGGAGGGALASGDDGGSHGDGSAVTGTDGGGPSGDATAGDDSGGALPPLQECDKPSIDRLEDFLASGEGTTVPMTGNLLVKVGDHYVAKQQFIGNDWHVTAVWLGNAFNAQVDLSNSPHFTLTWSSTADLWIQMRPGFHYDGGGQWVTKVPSTGGQVQTQSFSLDAAAWTTIPLGMPTWTYAMARAAVRGFVFVGDAPNVITISGLRIDGYVPPCM